MNFLLYTFGEKHQASKSVLAFIIIDKWGYGDTKMHLRILILFSSSEYFSFIPSFQQ